jgi:hypothetical protein
MELNAHGAILWPNHMRRNGLVCRNLHGCTEWTADRFCPESSKCCPESDNLLPFINFDLVLTLYGNLPG